MSLYIYLFTHLSVYIDYMKKISHNGEMCIYAISYMWYIYLDLISYRVIRLSKSLRDAFKQRF